ncbi:cytochrome c biogenesis protein CcdA [Aneurinibacillus sp. Ricciae_BoGa-3]|uniref:cytochrome c biogenesis CcdA family protein n=1 Tax=Aneurinibacillus sp. Ricciae_BoGa-3 TaxID=3022697 RepID=UPI0023407FF4|nr:cytochrome c biogenesis protein CcdA [Aneurinibacillus sp. Ricciae_BoGa-3]WCK54839.1 cytochrome c biogenesis protein CcdA [Aneurinibacillus sp. Ricciae_BoGa-3]
MIDMSIWVAFGAGFLSFVSPCCLPLYPTFLSYITGVSVSEIKNTGLASPTALIHTFFFTIGFSIIFFALGFSTTFLGALFKLNQDLIRQIGAILIAVMGLVMAGIFTPKFMMKEYKMHFTNRPTGYVGSTLIGITFAAGWTPCVGPILTAVLGLSVANPTQGIWYMIAYTLGFSIPFYIMSFFIGKMRWISRYSGFIMKIGGVTMILLSVLLYTNQMSAITRTLIRLYGGFSGF